MSGGDGRGERHASFGWLLAAIAFLALAWRVVYVLTVTRFDRAIYDSYYYTRIANAVAAGKGFIDVGPVLRQAAPHPPLTVLVLAPVAKVFGPQSWSAVPFRLTMALVGAGVVVLIGMVGRIVGGPRVGVVAAILAAVAPTLWMSDGLVMSESLAAFATALVLLAALMTLRRPRFRTAVLLGVACGLAALARSELILLVLLVAVPCALASDGPTRSRRVALAATSVLTTVLLISPWVAYNLSRFSEPVFLSTGDGPVLLGANCAAAYSGSYIGDWVFGCLTGHDAELHGDNSARSSAEARLALHYAREHASRLPLVVAFREGRYWGVLRPFQTANLEGGRPRWAADAGVFEFWLLAILTLGAAVYRLRGRPPPRTALPFVGTLVFGLVVPAIFFGSVRFRIPVDLVVIIGAAWILVAGFERLSHSATPTRA